MIIPVPRTPDEIRAAQADMAEANQREAHADAIVALTPAHRFLSPGPMTATWTNARGIWGVRVNYRDIGHHPIVEIDMPLMGRTATVPLPDHGVDYVRAVLVILGAIDPE